MRFLRLLVIGLAALLAINLTVAQDGNLLQDPGFEGPYVSRGRPDLNTPGAWNLWTVDSPRNYEWQNRSDRLYAFPHPAAPEKRNGASSFNLSGGYVTFTAALFQTVTVPNNANVTGSAWAWLHTCNIAKDANGNLIADNCASAVESGAYARVGIDPTGGQNPYAASVIWSANITPHQRWEQATVSATAVGTSVTMFIFVTQAWPADINRAYFDDAFLGIGGAGGVAPVVPGVPGAPTLVPTQAFARPVMAQAPRPDGSIVHIVTSGDTMSAIAFAYQMRVDDIMALNPTLRSPRFIFVGQELLIRAAGSAAVGASGANVTPRPTISDEELLRGGDGYLNATPGPTPMGMSR